MKEQAYFDWLCSLIEAGPDHNYQGRLKLLYQLFKKPYTARIWGDEHRAKDGLYLRKVYKIDNYNEPVSVLEVLIALARRMELDILSSRIGPDKTSLWMTKMLMSLGILECIDDRYDPEYVDICIDRWLDGSYEPNGAGSPFTIRDPNKDVRDMELWYVVQLWILENY